MKQCLRFSFALFVVLTFAFPLTAQVSPESISPGSISLGSVSLGATTSATVTLTLPSAAILGSIQVLTQGAPDLDYTLVSGGSCTPGNSYAANDTCTVEAEFAPRYPGVRSGAVVLFDNSGNVLANVYLVGIGSGPQTIFSGGAENAIASNVFLPYLLLDQNGNIYFAPANGAEITQETPSSSGYTQSTFSLNGRVGPLAIDGAGNFFVAVGNVVYKETRTASGYVESTIGADQSLPYVADVAVDVSGNVYLSTNLSTSGTEIVMETPSSGGYTSSVLFNSQISCNGGALSSCASSLTVDASGNVYAALNTQVVELTPAQGSYTSKVIVTGLSFAAAIAVDTNGNLFVADEGNSRVVKETPWNGSYIQSIVPSQSLSYPTQVAVDQTGNVYIVDSEPQSATDNLLIQQLLKENYSAPPRLTFATTSPDVASSDSPRTVVVTNDGTAPLNFSGVTYGSNFPETTQLPGACTSSTSLPVGANCVLTINFKPELLPDNDANPFEVSGTVPIVTDTLNSAGTKQEVSLNGQVTRAANSVYIHSTPNPSHAGSSVAVTAVVAGAAAGPVPTGSVNFFSGATALSTVPLTGGVASFSTSTLPKGTDTLSATYSGDSVYTSATSNSVAQVVGLSIPSVILSASSSTSFVGTPIQFTATVAGAASNPTPTGTITFSSGSTNLGSAPLISGSATLSVGLSPAGTQTVVAVYSGDSNYVPAPSLNGVDVTLTLAQFFDSAPPLTAGSTTPVTVTMPSVATLTSISVLTLGIPNRDFTNAGGGTCAVGTIYAQGATCTVNVAFNPTHAGIHSGAVVIMDSTSSTTIISTAYLQGTLDGPQLAFSSNPFNNLGSVPIYPNNPLTTYSPGGLAVDPGGNLFVAAVGSGVTKWALANGVYTQTNITSSGGPGIALDGSGNLFLACGSTLCKLSPQSNGSYSSSTAATGFNSLFGVAIDGAGNLYLTDSGTGAVYKETVQPDGTYLQSSIGTGWRSPNGLALDSSGNIAVTDPADPAVIEETLSGGEYSKSTVSTSINSPVAVTFDASGTLFVAGNTQWYILGDGCSTQSIQPGGGQGLWQETPESGNTWLQTQFYTGSSDQVILNDDATGDLYLVDTGLTPNTCTGVYGQLYSRSASQAAPLGFGSVIFGTASPSQAVAIENQGNQPLIFSSIHFPTDFPESAGISTECKVGTPLPPAASCTLTATFQPAKSLPNGAKTLAFTESITLTTNSLSMPQQSISLSGTETLPSATPPVFSLPSGNYTSDQTLTLSDTTPGAVIYYTTDGSLPTTSSYKYQGAITIASTQTVTALAVAPGYINSVALSVTYNINLPAATATPVFSPVAGTYTSTQKVTVTDTTHGALIYYTTDGTKPTTTSTRYLGAITISSTETLEAFAAAPGYANSAVASAIYTITSPAATPVFSPAAGSYTSVQSVTITDATGGAVIYYTIDGTMPTTSSTLYAGAIQVSSTETIQAIAVAAGYSNSTVASATYTINLPPPGFSISVSQSSLTVAPGKSGTVMISLTPQNGFTSATTFSCTGLSAGVTCTFSPASVTPAGGVATTTLTVSASSSASVIRPDTMPRFPGEIPGATLAIAFSLLGWRRQRSIQKWMLVAIVSIFGAVILSGCGGSSSPKPVTSTVSVIATSGTIQQTIPLTITIQ